MASETSGEIHIHHARRWLFLGGANREADDGDTGPGGVYQFVSFVFWYVAMIACCLAPTCLALRRRRQLERNEQERRRREESGEGTDGGLGGLVVLGGTNGSVLLWTAVDGSGVLTLRVLNDSGAPPAADADATGERAKRLGEAMKETTFVVRASDLLRKPGAGRGEDDDDDKNDGGREASFDPETNAVEPNDRNASDADDDDDDDEPFAELRLPPGRTVPASCAICLSSYRAGDRVAYASVCRLRAAAPAEGTCPHAFHAGCISEWLAGRDGPHRTVCPCCRRPFCAAVPLSPAGSGSRTVPSGDGSTPRTAAI
ncbi:unnamed protein product [Pseudo-nitzschia multistriata]|uniref:RING-type domain-containing protein n=1 Tax=Pseudo-nitzschia multistriata TaxID=183589 RepID=A0A448ZBC3_9STRA|nr:unnamed protein product [Pseudo-nitzschia multistriata]